MRLAAVRSLTAVSLAAALAVSVRAMVGIFVVGPLRFASPMGMESLFAGAFLAIVLLQSQRSASAASAAPDAPVASAAPGASAASATPTTPAAPARNAARFQIAPLLAALAVVAAVFIPSLRDPFLSDDYILVSRATLDPARILAVFHTPGGDGSFRPLGYLYFALLHRFGGVDPLKWHACALAVHLINCALLYLIVLSGADPPVRGRPPGRLAGSALRLVPLPKNGSRGTRADQGVRPTFLAFTAAVLFGLNGTRPEAVAWTAGNFDLLACAFTLAATLAILRRRIALALPLLFLGILCKESAYAAPAVVFGFAAAGNRLRESRIRLGLIASIAICAVMFAYRWSLFHGPGGYIDAATGQPQVLSFHLGATLKALFLRVWANLLFPVNWDASAKSAILAAALLIGSGAVLYAAFGSAAFGNRLSRRIALSMLALTMGALLPAYHLALIGDNLNGSRILYMPAIGFCVLCAHLLCVRLARTRWLVAAVLMVCTGAILLHNLDAWHRNAVLADQVCAGVTTQAPVHDLNGVVFFANGYKECVELKVGLAHGRPVRIPLP
jgi:hypothetical protein